MLALLNVQGKKFEANRDGSYMENAGESDIDFFQERRIPVTTLVINIANLMLVTLECI